MVEALEQQYFPIFIREHFVEKPSASRRIAQWRLERARAAGRQARLLLLGWHGTFPLDPELERPSPAPGIHLVLRGSTPGVYYGVDWNGLNVQEGNDMLIYSWATELEAYEFSATVRGESEYACCFDYKLVWQHRLHQQHQELEDYASYTNPWAGLVHP